MKKLLALLVMSLLISGCATYAVRIDGQKPTPVFPATELDAFGFVEVADSGYWYCGLPIFLDVPFSLVSDTVCLPYDLIKWGFK